MIRNLFLDYNMLTKIYDSADESDLEKRMTPKNYKKNNYCNLQVWHFSLNWIQLMMWQQLATMRWQLLQLQLRQRQQLLDSSTCNRWKWNSVYLLWYDISVTDPWLFEIGDIKLSLVMNNSFCKTNDSSQLEITISVSGNF